MLIAPQLKAVVGQLMDLLDTVRTAWRFTGLEPRAIIDQNAFGNLLVEDYVGQIWRICPEELSWEQIASSSQELQKLRANSEFVTDWEMEPLVSIAISALGKPIEGRCFCLKIPAMLGGKYEIENFGTIGLTELISVSGDMALQIKDVPTGTKVRLKIM